MIATEYFQTCPGLFFDRSAHSLKTDPISAVTLTLLWLVQRQHEVGRVKMIIDEQEQTTLELTNLRMQIENLESRKLALREHFEKTTLQEKIRQALSNFSKRCDLQKQQIIQAIIPKIVIHPDNKLEIVINPLFRSTPEGGDSKNSVNGGKKFVLDKNGSGSEAIVRS